jgi:hypothetical protein
MIASIKNCCLSPFFRPLYPALMKFEDYEQLPSVAELNQRLRVKGIEFVSQGLKSEDFSSGYEPRIYERGEVQTRENSWHDFFNALVWQQFPESKKAINALHYDLQKKRFPDKNRLRAENVLAHFDENGAIVICQNAELLDLIREHRWHELFWMKREELKLNLQVQIFGHGLYEKLLNPFVGVTAKALLFQSDKKVSIDTLLAKFISDNGQELEPAILFPLPVLGLPGWWAENEEESFYFDKTYFRDKISNILSS